MQLTATLPGDSLESLAARVYDLGDQPPPGAVRAATRALAEANPVLRRMSDVAPGTLIEVPALEGAEHRPGASASDDALAAGLVSDHVQAAAALIGRQLFADVEA